jgi:hypothetical protein
MPPPMVMGTKTFSDVSVSILMSADSASGASERKVQMFRKTTSSAPSS